MADNIHEVISVIRQSMPGELSPAQWNKILHLATQIYGTHTVYIPREKKRARLETIMDYGDEDTASLAKRLGVSQRRVQQMKKLIKE
ncbi:MAG: hypothetical protein LBL72_08460 [Candidatus Accumulibacter sp.]|jgi:hypothetical protein|nr:hypothetical protein [Accumulibacter sp.]